MIESAEEFISLRSSEIKSEYDRSALEEAPISVWLDIIDKYPDYRGWVAHNKTIPIEILDKLSNYDEDTRVIVASKRKLTLEMFEKLACDSSSSVRISIIVNKKTPLEIIRSLTLDKDKQVADIATRHYKRRQEEINSKRKYNK